MGELSEGEQLHQPAFDIPVSVPAATGIAPDEPAASAGAPTTPPLADLSATPGPDVLASQPAAPLLRLWRFVAGAVLLALAWGFLYIMLVLADSVWSFIHRPHALLLRAGAGLGAALAGAWLLVAMVACVLAGAYCLMLAVSRRGW